MNALLFRLLFPGLLLPNVLCAADLKDVKTVYLYPMPGGLDQHLANQLTNDHVFRVVADPRLADAIFTDQLGKQFEYRLDHIKREPVPATPPAPPAGPPPATPPSVAPLAGNVVSSADAEPHSTTFSRGKGTLFLVDAKSRQVVWSDYRRPKNTSSRELNKTAKRITETITKTLAPPPAKTE